MVYFEILNSFIIKNHRNINKCKIKTKDFLSSLKSTKTNLQSVLGFLLFENFFLLKRKTLAKFDFLTWPDIHKKRAKSCVNRESFCLQNCV